MFVHVFGAYFGIVVARILYKDAMEKEDVQDKGNSHYHSDLFAMIGIFKYYNTRTVPLHALCYTIAARMNTW